MNGGLDVSSPSKGWITTKNDSDDQNGTELSRWSLHNRTEWWINDSLDSLFFLFLSFVSSSSSSFLVRLFLFLLLSLVRLFLFHGVSFDSHSCERGRRKEKNPDKQSSSKVTSSTDFLLVSHLLRLLIFMTMASSSMIINNKTVGLKLEGKKGWNGMQVGRRDEKSDEISNSILILLLSQ